MLSITNASLIVEESKYNNNFKILTLKSEEFDKLKGSLIGVLSDY